MLKGILAFVLTRRTIVLLGLMVFLGGGIAAFTMLNIEAYPQPAPVIIEITAQQGGLSAEEMERYYTVPMEVGIYGTPYITRVKSASGCRLPCGCGSRCCLPTSPRPWPRDGAKRKRTRCANRGQKQEQNA